MSEEADEFDADEGDDAANEAFTLRPPKHWPPLADALRRSLAAGAGRIGRLWVEELVPDDDTQPATLVVAAELRGGARGQQDLFDARDDLRRRVAEDVDPADLGGRDPDRLRYAVFLSGDDDPFVAYFRDAEPVFGEPRHRFLNLATLRRCCRHRGCCPERSRRTRTSCRPGDFSAALSFVLVAAAVSPGSSRGCSARACCARRCSTPRSASASSCSLPFLYTLSVLPATTWRTGRVRTQPLVIAHVVQAFEALWVPSHPEYPDGARFGLVLVFTLDPRRRVDTAWLGWLARRCWPGSATTAPTIPTKPASRSVWRARPTTARACCPRASPATTPPTGRAR